MTDKNANTEIHKEFCPNCEAETPCTHEAELYVCDICGEDFAKYIVSRNCNVSDVSTTQNVTTPQPPEDTLHARIAECESALISMVQQFFYNKDGENIFRHSFMSAEEEAAEYLVEHGIARWVGKNKSAICFNEVNE